MKIILLLLSVFAISCTQATSQEEAPKFLRNHNSPYKAAGKARSFFNIKLESIETDKSFVELIATVKAVQDFSTATIEWQWPNHLEIVDGEKISSESFAAGETKTFAIKIKADTLKENDSIFFFAYNLQNGERYGASTNFLYKASGQFGRDTGIQQKTTKNPKIIQ